MIRILYWKEKVEFPGVPLVIKAQNEQNNTFPDRYVK